MQAAAARALGHPELAGADVGDGQTPAARCAAVPVEDNGAEPVVAPGRQHALLEHRAGGEHPGDAAAQQGPLGGGGLQLVAEGHAEAAAHQVGAVALGGVVGDARHRHPAQGLAGVLAGEGELEQAREQDRVLEEELVEVAEAVKQHPVRMGRLQLHVVPQHRGECRRVHQGMVVPAGQVAIGLRAGVAGRRRGATGVANARHTGLLAVALRAGGGHGRWPLPAGAGPGAGIGQQGLVVRGVPIGRRLRCQHGGLGRAPEQVPLQGRIVSERELLLDFPGHGSAVRSVPIVRGSGRGAGLGGPGAAQLGHELLRGLTP